MTKILLVLVAKLDGYGLSMHAITFKNIFEKRKTGNENK